MAAWPHRIADTEGVPVDVVCWALARELDLHPARVEELRAAVGRGEAVVEVAELSLEQRHAVADRVHVARVEFERAVARAQGVCRLCRLPLRDGGVCGQCAL